MHYAFGSIRGVWRLRDLLSWNLMASLGHTLVQSKQRMQRELSTNLFSTLMHLAEQTSSHFMQLIHLSGSMAMCISAWECRHPRAVPIGQTVVQNAFPLFHAHRSIGIRAASPTAAPMPTEIPIPPHVIKVSSGRTVEAALRMIFQGSTA